MKISKLILTTGNKLVSFMVVVTLCVSALYASYALWDNNRIYAAAADVQADMLKLKPDDDDPSFEELLSINPDVVGWITLEGTKIDHPVLQGKTNLTYINTDVYGDFSLAGSIFLDSRNDRNFGDTYSLLHGHHMENSKMFGDLELYKDEKFFRENQTGTLLLSDKIYQLEIFASLLVPSSEERIFNPGRWEDRAQELVQYAKNNALYLNENKMNRIMESMDGNPQVLALTTCSTEFTDARTVVLAFIKPQDHGQNRTIE